MIYIFHEDAGRDKLNIKGDLYRYLIKVRRHKIGDKLKFRSKSDLHILHSYELSDIQTRVITLTLLDSQLKDIKNKKKLHIGWCIVDSKSIEKILPSLCEIGLDKISFIYCDRSQQNFKIDFKRLDRIQEASMQQSGRNKFIEFNTYSDIDSFIKHYPETKVFDFCDNIVDNSFSFETVLIGCEGGFSEKERDILSNQKKFRFNTPMVLRSETAVLAVTSKILL